MCRTVLITGATKGFGKEIFNQFADNKNVSDKLITCGRSDVLLSINRHSTYIQGDLKDPLVIKQLIDACDGKLDILINNAGTYYSETVPFLSTEEITNCIDINLITPIVLINKAWPLLLKSKIGGVIVNINSVAGLRGGRNECVYSASKFGLRGFTDSLKNENPDNRIRILDVYLGAMKTSITLNRSNYDNLIDPKEAAELVYESLYNKKSCHIREMMIGRVK